MGHLFMKQLLKREAAAQREAESSNDPGDENDSFTTTKVPSFAEGLLDRAGVEIVSWIRSNRGAFVLAALEDVPTVSPRLREILGKAAKTKILEAANAEGTNVGVKVNEALMGCGMCVVSLRSVLTAMVFVIIGGEWYQRLKGGG